MSQTPLTIETQSGAIGLTLDQAHVTMHATDALKETLREETTWDADNQSPGLAGRFARFVTGSVQAPFEREVSCPVEDIESVTYDGKTLTFSYRRKHALSFEGVREENQPALGNFSADDARVFMAAFNQQKASTGG